MRRHLLLVVPPTLPALPATHASAQGSATPTDCWSAPSGINEYATLHWDGLNAGRKLDAR